MQETIDILVKAYIKLRSAKEDLRRSYELQDKDLQDQMNTIQFEILDFCKNSGLDSLKTKYGTAMRSVKERYWCTDWDSFRTFVKENDAIELFEKRIHQTNMKQFMETNPELLPPGMNIEREYSITIRKAK
jgi:phage terminase large subunit GpA-like protein